MKKIELSSTPLIADLRPGGRYLAADLDRAGGMELVAKRLVEAGALDGSRPTPSGRTLAEEVAPARETPGQDVVLIEGEGDPRPQNGPGEQRVWPRPVSHDDVDLLALDEALQRRARAEHAPRAADPSLTERMYALAEATERDSGPVAVERFVDRDAQRR